MQEQQLPERLALHEALDIRELLTFKTVMMTKAKTMQILVSDEELKQLMQFEHEQAQQDIAELQSLLERRRPAASGGSA